MARSAKHLCARKFVWHFCMVRTSFVCGVICLGILGFWDFPIVVSSSLILFLSWIYPNVKTVYMRIRRVSSRKWMSTTTCHARVTRRRKHHLHVVTALLKTGSLEHNPILGGRASVRMLNTCMHAAASTRRWIRWVRVSSHPDYSPTIFICLPNGSPHDLC